MKTKLAKLALIAVLSTAGATTAFAHDAARTAAKQMIELKDGSTLYIFKDGKMAMEDRYGRATRMEIGAVMETKDGRQVKMESDEVARLQTLIDEGHYGGYSPAYAASNPNCRYCFSRLAIRSRIV